MFRRSIVVTLLLLCCAVTVYARPPKPFARTAEVKRPMGQVFESLKKYFASDTRSFDLLEANATKGIVKAHRDGVDSQTWGQWAYCKTSPLNILDSLEDGSVVVKVVLEADGKTATHVAVLADFTGEYSLAGSNKHIVKCESLGALEDDILRAAGPSDDEPME